MRTEHGFEGALCSASPNLFFSEQASSFWLNKIVEGGGHKIATIDTVTVRLLKLASCFLNKVALLLGGADQLTGARFRLASICRMVSPFTT